MATARKPLVIVNNTIQEMPAGDFLSLAAGGTGAAPATDAALLQNIGAAASGANGDITSLSGLTTPLSVGQGGTGDAGTAWASDTTTPSASSGALTSATCSRRYKFIGKLVLFEAIVSIATNGTGAGVIQVPLPTPATAAAAGKYIIAGREGASTGKMLQGIIAAGASTLQISNYDNSYPGGSGYQLSVSGLYEGA